MRRHINLRQIEAFKAIVENGTVSRAALLLNMSQPAVSRLLAHLEFDTGLELFDRVKGRLAPTEHGMRLYDEVGRIFAGVRQVENAVDAIQREKQGRLAIGVMPALSGSFVERATASFVEHNRGVFCTVQSQTSQWIVDWLITRKLDVGLVGGSMDNPYITCEPLVEHPLVCVMHPDHELAQKSVIGLSDIEGLPFIAFHPDADVGSLVGRMFDAHSFEPNVVMVANISPTVCEFVAAGLGISLIHPLMLSGLEHRLVARRFEPEVLYYFQLCRSAESRNAALVEAFATEVRATAAEVSEGLLNAK